MIGIDDWFSFLRDLDSSIGIVLVGLGLALLLQGHRLYEGAVLVTYVALAFGVAATLAEDSQHRWLVAAGASIAIGGLSWWLRRFAVAVLGGLGGLLVVSAILEGMGLPYQVSMALGVGAFIALTAMAFVNWMQVVIFATSLEGAFLLVSDVAVVTNLNPAWFNFFHGLLLQSALVLPFALFFPTATGCFLQTSGVNVKESGGGR